MEGIIIHNGFYTERDVLEKECMEYEGGFGFMENTPIGVDTESGRKINAYDFLHGYCESFAYALHKQFGYQMCAVYDTDGILVHAYCTYNAHGMEYFVDIRGCTNNFKEFIEEFDDFLTITEDFPADIHKFRACDKEPIQIKCAMEFVKNNKGYYMV